MSNPEPIPNAEAIEKNKADMASKESAVEAASTDLQGKLRDVETPLKEAGLTLDPAVRAELEAFFKSSVNRADTDKDGRISAAELEVYKIEMMKEADGILKKFSPKKTELDAAQKQKEAGQEALAKAPEKTADKLPPLESIPDGNNVPVEKLESEMEKFGGLNESFQFKIKSAFDDIETFSKAMQTYQESKTGFSAISYLAKRWTGMDGKEVEELNAKLEATKKALEDKKTQLTKWKVDLAKYGQQLGNVANRERDRLIAERDKKAKEITTNQPKEQQEIDAKKGKYNELQDQQKQLTAKRDSLLESRKVIAEKKQEVTTNVRQDLSNKFDAVNKNEAAATQEITALEFLLKDENLSDEGKIAINNQLTATKARLGQAGTTKTTLNTAINVSLNQVQTALDDKDKKVSQGVVETDSLLQGQIDPGLQSTMQTISLMEDLKLQYVTTGDQLIEVYNTKIKGVDDLDKSVDDIVLQSSVANIQSLSSLEKTSDQIKTVQITQDHWAMAPFTAYGGLWSGVFADVIGKGFNGVGKWIIEKSNDLVDLSQKNDNSLFTKVAGGIGANAVALVGGVAGGVCELAGGVSTMVGHPIETGKGMGALIGRDPESGKFTLDTVGEAWKNLGKGLIAYDDWEKGKATAAGKVVANIGTLFIGAGEVGAVAKAGAAGRIAAESAALAAEEAAVAAGTKLGRFGRLSKTVPARLGAFGRTLGTEVVEGIKGIPAGIKGGVTKGIPKLVGKGVDAVWNAGREVLKHPIKAPAGALFETGVVVKDVFLIPFLAIPRLATTLFRLAKSLKGEARFAKAAQALTKENPNLVKLKAEVDGLKTRPEIDKLLQESEALKLSGDFRAAEVKATEAFNKALEIINKDNPELVQSYFNSKDALAKVQQNGKTLAEDAADAIKKAKKGDEFEEYNKLLKEKAAKPGDKAAADAVKAYEKEPANSVNIAKYKELEAAEAELEALGVQIQSDTGTYLRTAPDKAVLDTANSKFVRQATELKIKAELGKVLEGKTTVKDIEKALKKKYGAKTFEKGSNYTELFTKNIDGKDYVIMLTDTGKVEMLDAASMAKAIVDFGKAESAAGKASELALEYALEKASAKAVAAGKPAIVLTDAQKLKMVEAIKDPTTATANFAGLTEAEGSKMIEVFNELGFKLDPVFDASYTSVTGWKFSGDKAAMEKTLTAAAEKSTSILESAKAKIVADKVLPPEFKKTLIEHYDEALTTVKMIKTSVAPTVSSVAAEALALSKAKALAGSEQVLKFVKGKMIPENIASDVVLKELMVLAVLGYALGAKGLANPTEAELAKMSINQKIALIENNIQAVKMAGAEVPGVNINKIVPPEVIIPIVQAPPIQAPQLIPIPIPTPVGSSKTPGGPGKSGGRKVGSASGTKSGSPKAGPVDSKENPVESQTATATAAASGSAEQPPEIEDDPKLIASAQRKARAALRVDLENSGQGLSERQIIAAKLNAAIGTFTTEEKMILDKRGVRHGKDKVKYRVLYNPDKNRFDTEEAGT